MADPGSRLPRHPHPGRLQRRRGERLRRLPLRHLHLLRAGQSPSSTINLAYGKGGVSPPVSSYYGNFFNVNPATNAFYTTGTFIFGNYGADSGLWGARPCRSPAGSSSSSACPQRGHPAAGGLYNGFVVDEDRLLPAHEVARPSRPRAATPTPSTSAAPMAATSRSASPAPPSRTSASSTRPATSPPRPTTAASVTTSSPSTGRAPDSSSSSPRPTPTTPAIPGR